MDASTELNVVSIASIFGLRKFSLLVSLFPRGSAAAYSSFYRNRFLSQCIQLLLFSTIYSSQQNVGFIYTFAISSSSYFYNLMDHIDQKRSFVFK